MAVADELRKSIFLCHDAGDHHIPAEGCCGSAFYATIVTSRFSVRTYLSTEDSDGAACDFSREEKGTEAG